VISNFATIAVTSRRAFCSDPTGFAAADLQTVQNGGTLDLLVANIELSDPALGAGEQTIQLGSLGDGPKVALTRRVFDKIASVNAP
jgi:hypothetical protein